MDLVGESNGNSREEDVVDLKAAINYILFITETDLKRKEC